MSAGGAPHSTVFGIGLAYADGSNGRLSGKGREPCNEPHFV